MFNNHVSTTRGDVLKKVATLCAGMTFCQTGFYVVLTLQSSINISEGLGAATMTATYISAAVCGLFFTPLMLQHLGPKACILICESIYLVYTLANYYPRYFTLMPTAILDGFAEATLWPSLMLFASQFGREYSQFMAKDEQTYVTQFAGIAYSSMFLSGVLGNSLSQVIFFGGSSTAYEPSSTNVSMTTAAPFVRDLSVCGRNDCQDPNVISINYEAYRPASEFLLHVLFGVMASLIAIAFIIHATLLGKYVPKSKLDTKQPTDDISLKEEDVDVTLNTPTKKNALDKMISTAKAVFLQLSNPRQLLLVPMFLYYGLVFGLWMTDFTRAFVSCTLGVEKVSLYSLIATFSGASVAVASGVLAGYVGRNVLFCAAFAFDLSYMLLAAIWTPSADSTWILYLIFIGCGFSDGIWPAMCNSMIINYFPDNEEIALSIWSLSLLLGMAWQTGWSTTLCVYQKIYFQIGMLCFGMICHPDQIYYIFDFSSIHYNRVNFSPQQSSRTQATSGYVPTLTDFK